MPSPSPRPSQHPAAYVGQWLLVLEQQEAVALLRAGILQDQGEVLDVSQRQAVLQCHHHVLQMPRTGLGARHWHFPRGSWDLTESSLNPGNWGCARMRLRGPEHGTQ